MKSTSSSQLAVPAALPWFSRINVAVFFGLLAALAAPQRAQATTNPLAETVTTLVITDSMHHRVNQVNYGAAINLTASVKTIQGQPVYKGTIVFCDGAVAQCLDGHSLGSAQIVLQPPPNLAATLTIIPKFGAHTYRAVYLGTTTVTSQNPAYGSTSAESLFKVVGPPPPGTTSTTITSSGTRGNYTLTAKVMGIGGGTVKPTGTVNFLDASNGNALLGSGAVGSTAFSFGFAGPQALPQMPPFLYTLSAVADVNNDGYPDLILLVPDYSVAGQYDLEVMLNSSSGFAPPVEEATLPLNVTPLAIVTGDFNNDDKVDLAISTDDGHVLIYQGSGFGPFGLVANGTLQTYFIVTSMVVGDFTNSGNQSIAAVTPLGYTVLVGNGDYTFSPGTGNFGPNNDWDSAIAAGDVNGDGFPDLVMADPVTGKITVYLGNGQGLFAQTQSFSVGASPAAMVVADFNGDGFLDVATANSGDNTVSILLGDGTGNFTNKSTISTGATPMFLTSGDFNGDGITDLAVANFNAGTVNVLLGKGDGTFKKSTLTADSSVGVFAADFNADGYTDVAAIGASAPSVFLSNWMSTSTATLTGAAVAGANTHQVDASYAGDTTYQGSSSATIPLTAAPLATTIQPAVLPAAPVWGQPVTLTATLSPYTAQGHGTDGELVTFYNGSANLGTAPLTLGVATLPVSSLSVGLHNIKAGYGGDANFAASGTWISITVGKAASSTVLTAATYSPKVGVADLLTATVTGSSSPRGNVVFTQDGNTICSVPLGTNGKATCAYTPWATTASSLVAGYQGDAKYAASNSAPLSLTATATYSAKIVLSFDTTQLTYPGATNTKTCITRSTSATPTGTVNILDGPTTLQTLTVGGDGCAYWYINPGLNAGIHPMRAWYSGDANNPSGYSAITNVTVSQTTTSWSHACWNPSFQAGQNYQCNVSAWSNAGSPPGNILYSYDGGPSQQAPLAAGDTSFVISLPAVGNHTVTLWYPGAQNYTATSPQTESFTVTQ